jgi:uridine kinase
MSVVADIAAIVRADRRDDEQVLRPLLAGDDLHYQVRDWAHDEYGDSLGPWKSLAWHPVVVIEGVTSTRRAIADALACRVWVEAPRDLRMRRGMERDGEDFRALWERWMAREAAFFAADDTRSRADVVVDGTRPLD